jgi:hypothetical protein
MTENGKQSASEFREQAGVEHFYLTTRSATQPALTSGGRRAGRNNEQGRQGYRSLEITHQGA